MADFLKYFSKRKFGRELVKHFDKIYCINLDSRPDRWKRIYTHLSGYGLKRQIIRFPAVDIRDNAEYINQEKLLENNFSLLGMCGCMLSHRSIIEHAKTLNYKNVLIFEDDVNIIEENIKNLDKSLESLATRNWDVFYLGATYLWELIPINPYLIRVVNGAYATHAIAYNNTVYDKILEILPANPKEYFESAQFEINAMDKWLQSDMFDHEKFYGTNPIMVVQALQESDIAFNQQANIEQRQKNLFYRNLKK
jgi:GR25 family glycosyltransferase involved in LPS biosynthesis